ncbi:MAG: Uma2 family endonuclease [Candidatus Entotheonellia bacterium]
MMPATLARHQWTSADYERMLAAGMFEKIELLCGDVVITGAGVRPYRWTLDDYEQLIALGLLEGKHVELIQGEILIMASMGEPHALTIMQLNYALLPHFNPATGFHLRIQMPLALPALTSEPEPDIAVVVLDTPTNEAGRPISASLLIEVAESSLAYDRDRKGPLYAAAGIQEYWLVNLPERCLEVYRQCMPDAASFSGWRYQERQSLRDGDQVAPLVAPEVVVAVGALLPPR